MSRAYYAAPIEDFRKSSLTEILGCLADNSYASLEQDQRRAWAYQIEHLQRTLLHQRDGWIFFEFSIPRIGRRVDVILLISGIIIVIEYKLGSERYLRSSQDQVMDYALDLKNFHAGSHELPIVPILLSTHAPTVSRDLVFGEDRVASVLLANEGSIGSTLTTALLASPVGEVDANQWMASGYHPTPTIVQAAQALYNGHEVAEISRSDAGATNLTRTAECIAQIIEEASQQSQKSICLLTGVPGAGKTLAGLNIATKLKRQDGSADAVFLSGNGPLVKVLREALTLDQCRRSPDIKKSDARRRTETFIQNVHHFRDDSLDDPNPPVNHVVVFDEAQRAWDKAQTVSFMTRKKKRPDFSMSEPEVLLAAMDRHPDWCCVVCLVGGGQEINTGEAGIGEWVNVLRTQFSTWKVYCSTQLYKPEYDWSGNLSEDMGQLRLQDNPDLHLSVSLRSFRSERVSDFVAAMIGGSAGDAKGLFPELQNYPIFLSRDLDTARMWVRERARGTERYGLLASSNGIRLKPDGVFVKQDIEPEQWFLASKQDIRSSFQLEDVATEFHVQGLELDWTIVCWDLNYLRTSEGWAFRNFVGTKWQNVKNPTKRRYIANSYRVLLTRARQGFVIFIPEGNAGDPTRPPAEYDAIYAYLSECGIPTL